MKRERGTVLVTAVLTAAAEARVWPLTMLDEIHVFGSYARGAVDPHDVDLAVELTADKEFAIMAAWRRARGSDPYTSVRQALVGSRRGVEFHFHELRMLHDDGIETKLLWRRGEALATALGRLHAIEPDPAAGRAPRDAMLPAFEGIDRWVPRPVREMLVAWIAAGAVQVERIVLPDATVVGTKANSTMRRRWADSSPIRRAANAAVAHLQHQGVDVGEIQLHGRDMIRHGSTSYFVGFQFRYWQQIRVAFTGRGGVLWLEVPHPTARGPLDALRITVLDSGALAALETPWR